MQPERCCSCEEALNQVSIPTWALQHITQRHYQCIGHEEIGEEQSLFYENIISPDTLSGTIINVLRSGLQPSHRQTICTPGALIVRYVYYYRFGFIIGVYPNRQGGFCETKRIKIVCNTTECQQCNRRLPTEVVTSYPY